MRRSAISLGKHRGPHWIFHMVADDDASTASFDDEKNAKEARADIIKMRAARMVSKVMKVMPGDVHWVFHVKRHNGSMHSFGFETKTEAEKFRKALRKVESVALISETVRDEVGG